MALDRRRFLESMAAAGVGTALLPKALSSGARKGVGATAGTDLDEVGLETVGRALQEAATDGEITPEAIAEAERLIGLRFTEEQRRLMLEDVNERLGAFEKLREVELPNHVPPALRFDPHLGTGAEGPPGAAGASFGPGRGPSGQGVVAPAARGGGGSPGGSRPAPTTSPAPVPPRLPEVERPARDEDLAYLTVAELASLLRSRQVGSAELTELYLERLKEHDPVLQAVVTFTEERARRQAAEADRELDAGRWRGPLHGVPWGAKDLLAVKGYPTTWGATPYREQAIEVDAAVVERLDAAGAVLVAKLTLGALAWGDVWFGGTTKNPWNVEQGSSGSSAGPGAAVAAGLVGFAIGSETLGSIVSPSTRNGVTGHRPTFGRVSRHGAMALSWSMDKLGPMCRSAEDCALAFAAMHGRDPRDPSTVDAPFAWAPDADVRELRVGYAEKAFEPPEGEEQYRNRDADLATLEVLRGLGVEVRPIALPEDPPAGPLRLILEAEAAAAFDELTRTGGVDTLVRQERYAWPNVFRHARFIPAVEYINANRARTRLQAAMAEALSEVDVFVSPSFRGGTLLITNLTGHPSVTVPNAFHPVEDQPPESPRRSPGSITFVGALYRDEAALALAHAYQRATDFHRRRPPIV